MYVYIYIEREEFGSQISAPSQRDLPNNTNSILTSNCVYLAYLVPSKEVSIVSNTELQSTDLRHNPRALLRAARPLRCGPPAQAPLQAAWPLRCWRPPSSPLCGYVCTNKTKHNNTIRQI